MKNWTVTLMVKHPFGDVTEVNEYVTEICGEKACEVAEKRAGEKYVRAFIERVEECSVSPRLAETIDEFLSEEYGHSAEDIRDTLKPNKDHTIPLLYSTVSLRDWKNKRTLTDDLDMQISINYLTGAFEIDTAGDWERAYVDGYYNDDKLAEMLEGTDFNTLYSEYADKVREWWVKHPENLKDWYDEVLPEGFEL